MVDTQGTQVGEVKKSVMLSIDELLHFKQFNKDMMPTIAEFFLANKNKIIKNNVQWRKFEQKQEHNWLVNKKFTQTDDEKLYAQFRGVLNKLTESNFNDLAKELVEQQITKKDHLETLVNLIFKKAIMEHKFSVMYARLSQQLSQYYIKDTENNKDIYFRDLLINKCQSMFNDCISSDTAGENQDKDQEKEKEQPSEPKSKQVMIGCMTFIGELYNYGLLINKIINSCFLLLIMKIGPIRPYIIDSVCTLMRIVGVNFSKNAPTETKNIFDKLTKLSDGDTLAKKDKFALLDLYDLRAKGRW